MTEPRGGKVQDVWIGAWRFYVCGEAFPISVRENSEGIFRGGYKIAVQNTSAAMAAHEQRQVGSI